MISGKLLSVAALCVAAVAISGCNRVAPPVNVTVSNGGSKVAIAKQITALGGASVRLGFSTAINPDCSKIPSAPPQVIQTPEHGDLRIVAANDFTSFRPPNPRAKCNTQRVPGYVITYTARKGYVGQDAFGYGEYTAAGALIEVNVVANIQ